MTLSHPLKGRHVMRISELGVKKRHEKRYTCRGLIMACYSEHTLSGDIHVESVDQEAVSRTEVTGRRGENITPRASLLPCFGCLRCASLHLIPVQSLIHGPVHVAQRDTALLLSCFQMGFATSFS